MEKDASEGAAFLNIDTESKRIKSKIKLTDGSGIVKQILISMIAITGGISTGLVIGFSSVSLPQLTDITNTEQIYLTPNQASWFASLTTITSPIGCLLCGPLSDRFGRRLTLLLLSLPCLLGWTLLATVSTSSPDIILQLYCGRILSGLTVGMSSIPATVYLAEIASNTKLRSMLMAWTSISITLGILIVYILGSIFRNHWQMIAMLCGILPIASIFLTWQFVPESPIWLISKNRPEEALTALKRLRGVKRSEVTPIGVEAEFERLLHGNKKDVSLSREKMEETINENDIEKKGDSVFKDGEMKLDAEFSSKDVESGLNNNKSLEEYIGGCLVATTDTLKALTRRESLKALFIMNGLFLFQQLSGYIVITYYSVDLLLKAGVSVDPYLATILLGLVQFLSGVAVSFVLTRCGRRPMSIASGAGMAVCMIGLGLNMEHNWFSSWFPLTALTAIVVFSMIGFRTVPWTILGEIYPLDIKGVAVGITTCNIYVFSFITVKLYPMLMDILKSTERIFYFYGVSCIIGTIFVIVFQPETHNKTLEQIQIEMKSKKVKKLTEEIS